MRPIPPKILIIDEMPEDFLPSPSIADFVAETFLNDRSPLFNEEHLHLLKANIGFLWTNVPNLKAGRQILGTAEIPRFQGNKWQRERQSIQQRNWFGDLNLDFLITLDAMYCAFASDLEFCALIEHELYHCGQAVDMFGAPRFNRETGKPVFTLRPHDVEQFSGIWRRYGVFREEEKEFLAAAANEPEIGQVALQQTCGNCAV